MLPKFRFTSRKPVLWTGIRKRITSKEYFPNWSLQYYKSKEYEIQLLYGTGAKEIRDCRINISMKLCL